MASNFRCIHKNRKLNGSVVTTGWVRYQYQLFLILKGNIDTDCDYDRKTFSNVHL